MAVRRKVIAELGEINEQSPPSAAVTSPSAASPASPRNWRAAPRAWTTVGGVADAMSWRSVGTAITVR